MLPVHLGLVAEVDGHDPADVARVCAAIQKQLIRDFLPVWGLAATITPFPTTADLPDGYWPVIVSDQFTFGSLGTHRSLDGTPFALVQFNDSWSLTASHESLEMVADPGGNRRVSGPSPKDPAQVVEFLLELCDPCEGPDCSYDIDGVLVSDFYTPQYFDAHFATSVRYSFTGALTQPRQVLRGGYLTWLDPFDGHWWQLLWPTEGEQQYVDHGVQHATEGSMREIVDRLTPMPLQSEGVPTGHPRLEHAQAVNHAVRASGVKRADALRAQIAALGSASRIGVLA